MLQCDCLDDFADRGVFGDVADSASLQSAVEHITINVHGEHHDAHFLAGGDQSTGGLDAVDGRHGDIHQNNIGAHGQGDAYAFLAVLCFTEHRDAFCFQGASQALAQHRVVVDEYD